MISQTDSLAPLTDLHPERADVPRMTRVAEFRDANGHPVFLFEVAP